MPEEKTEEKKGTSKAIAVNVNKVIKRRNGESIRHQPEYDGDFEFCNECAKKVTEALGEEMTVKSVIVNVLDSMPRNPDKGEKKLSGVDKLKRGKLAEKIYNSIESIELQIDDLALIKKLVGEVQTPLVISQVFPEIDPKTEGDC